MFKTFDYRAKKVRKHRQQNNEAFTTLTSISIK